MKIMMNLLCSAVVALAVSGCCCGSKCEHPFPPIDEAVASPIVAKTLKTVKIVFSVKGDSLKDPEMQLPIPATLTIRAKVPASARFDFTTEGAIYAAGFNNGKTWGYDNTIGICELNKEDDADLCRNLFFIPLELKIKQPYGEAKWIKDETIDEEEYSCFKALQEEGSPASVLVWINKKTNLVYKLETSDALNTYITIFEDYQDYEGVKLPASIYMSDRRYGFNSMHIESVEWNLPLEDSIFENPTPLKK